MSCALDSNGELSLMECTGTGNTAGEYLSSLGHALSEPCSILIIYSLYLIGAEYANLLAASLYASGRSLIISFHYPNLL